MILRLFELMSDREPFVLFILAGVGVTGMMLVLLIKGTVVALANSCVACFPTGVHPVYMEWKAAV